MSEVIAKAAIEPVVPTEISHHRELPDGDYVVELESFGSRVYLVRESNSGKRYLVSWCGKSSIFRTFKIKENGVWNLEEGLPGQP